jgi:hypothetical protein
VKKPTKTVEQRQWLSIITVVVFLLAAVGAGFALFTLLPAIMDDHAQDSLARFAAILAATFLIVVLAAGSIRRCRRFRRDK